MNQQNDVNIYPGANIDRNNLIYSNVFACKYTANI